MACSLGWNLQSQQDEANSGEGDNEDSAYVQYLWWTLVTLDIWFAYSTLKADWLCLWAVSHEFARTN